RFAQSQLGGLVDVVGEQRLAGTGNVVRRQRGHLPTVDADDIPFRSDASPPQQLGVVRLTCGEEQGWHLESSLHRWPCSRGLLSFGGLRKIRVDVENAVRREETCPQIIEVQLILRVQFL